MIEYGVIDVISACLLVIVGVLTVIVYKRHSNEIDSAVTNGLKRFNDKHIKKDDIIHDLTALLAIYESLAAESKSDESKHVYDEIINDIRTYIFYVSEKRKGA